MKQANQPFHYTSRDGVDHFVPKGTVVGDADPVLKGRAALFTQVPDLDNAKTTRRGRGAAAADVPADEPPVDEPSDADTPPADEPPADTTPGE